MRHTSVAKRIGGRRCGFLALAVSIPLTVILFGLPGCRTIPPAEHETPPDSRSEKITREFKARHGNAWHVQWNAATDTPRRLSGGNIPIREAITEQNIERITRAVLSENATLLSTSDAHLVLSHVDYDKPLRDKGQGTWYVFFNQVVEDVLVHGGTVKMIIRGQRLVSIGLDHYPAITPYPRPTLSSDQVVGIVQAQIGAYVKPIATTLVYYPTETSGELTYPLAWKVDMPTIAQPTVETVVVDGREVQIEKPVKAWIYFVDAQTGLVLQRRDAVTYGEVSGTVKGMVYENAPDVGQIEVPIANQNIDILQGGVVQETLTTNALGAYSSADTYTGQIEVLSHLKGPHVEVHNDELADPDATHSSGQLTVDATHDWNWTNDDQSPQDVETNAFYQVGWIRDWFLRGDPFDVSPFPYPMQVNVRIGEGCNAFASNEGLSFYSGTPAAGCLDLALSADVIYHEYAHRIFDKLYTNANYNPFIGAMNEGLSDYFPCSIFDDPWYGDVVDVGRNVDTGFNQGVTPQGNNRRYPRDWSDEVHADGLIFNGALWDLRKVLDANQTDALTMATLKTAPTDFADFLQTMLVLDDDDGDLSNGTPNSADICSSFSDLHGIFSPACAGQTGGPVAVISSPEIASYNLYGPSDNLVVLVGTALGGAADPLDSYTIEIANETSPANWLTTGVGLADNGTSTVLNFILGGLDLPNIDDGRYMVRLTVETISGAQAVAKTTVVIQKTLHEPWPLLQDNWVVYAPGIGDIDPTVPGLEVVVPTGSALYAFTHTGAGIVGGQWPFISTESLHCSPAVGDLDGDGSLEVVFTTYMVDSTASLSVVNSAGQLYSSNWPVKIADVHPWPTTRNSSPTLADIDQDGDLEIVVGSADNNVYVFHHDGFVAQGWPQSTKDRVEATPAVGDIDPDYPGLEVVVGSTDSILYAWHADGTDLAPAWPIKTGGELFASAALGDLDEDGDLEIVASSNDSSVTVWDHEGNELFKNKVSHRVHSSSPALGDVDGDGDIEIVAMAADHNLYIWHHDGTPEVNWNPLSSILINGFTFVPSSPVIADIDGDGDNEIVVEGIGKVHAFHHDGTELTDGWPKYTFDHAEGSSPVVFDADGDGLAEILVGAAKQGAFLFDLPGVYDPDRIQWPMFHHDTAHTGVYVPPPPVVIYVNDATGNDTWDGLSASFTGGTSGPKKMIQAGIDVTPQNGICQVAPGKYVENIVLKGGIVLAGAGPDSTVIDGGQNQTNVITIGSVSVPSTDADIHGFTITGGGAYGDNAGIRVQNSQNSVIRNNVITGNGADGIRVYSGSPRIYNNTIVQNGRNGVMVHNGATPEIKNNIVVSNTNAWPMTMYGWGLFASNNAAISTSHNNVWKHNNDYGSQTGGVSVPGPGDISANPSFNSLLIGGFRLQSGSPCIDAGVDVGLSFAGSAPDMGAFESQP